MKKLFTLALIMLGSASASLSAQNFVLQKGAEGTTTYADGDVITVGYTTSTVDGLDGWLNVKWDPELHVKANKAGSYTLTVTTDMSGLQVCSFTGQCTIVSGSTSRTASLKAGAVENLLVDVTDFIMEGQTPTAITSEQTATVNMTSNGESITVTLKFIPEAEGAGIGTVTAPSTSDITVSGKVLHYSFTQPTQVKLYTISGQAAMSRTLNGAGSLNLQGLPAGIYLYRAGKNTGKFMIR
jgi:hypothetical protein